MVQLFFQYNQWLNSYKIKPIDACVNFLRQFREIDKIIVGIDSLTQLEEVLLSSKKSMQINFPDFSSEDLELINPSNWQI